MEPLALPANTGTTTCGPPFWSNPRRRKRCANGASKLPASTPGANSASSLPSPSTHGPCATASRSTKCPTPPSTPPIPTPLLIQSQQSTVRWRPGWLMPVPLSKPKSHLVFRAGRRCWLPSVPGEVSSTVKLCHLQLPQLRRQQQQLA